MKALKDHFEQVYGNRHYFEQALKGAVPVMACPSGGYASVGFTRRTELRTDSDIYVVRVGDNGAAIWERTYDLGEHFDDVGTSIRELYHSSGTGFIITGTTTAGDEFGRDIFLLKIDCSGDLVWLKVLKTMDDLSEKPSDDVANDVIETNTGPLVPLGNPRQGDLVVAGFSRRPDGDVGFETDAYLVRTDSQGSVIWSQTYANWGESDSDPHAREWFNALSEAWAAGGTAVGDILAAGAQADSGWEDGLAVRVSGVNGGFNAPLHIMASFNVPDEKKLKERFTELWAIRELHQTGSEQLNIVVVGNIAEAGQPTEGYVAKTDSKLNNPLVERVIGDGFDGSGDEGFADFQEIAAPTSYGSAGDLVVAGYATTSGSQDMAMLALSTATLAPVPGTGRLFGDHGGHEERATALSQAPVSEYTQPGFYLNGFTRSDPVGDTDPEDMFLVRTNAGGTTSCSLGWEPDHLEPGESVCYADEYVEDPETVSVEWQTLKETPSWGNEICQ